MKHKFGILLLSLATIFTSCNNQEKDEKSTEKQTKTTEKSSSQVDQFADIKILRYEIPGWENLDLKKQELVYYITQAGLAGRDIIWAQNYKHNLKIRKALENVYTNYEGDKDTEDWKPLKPILNGFGFPMAFTITILMPKSNQTLIRNIWKTYFQQPIPNSAGSHWK